MTARINHVAIMSSNYALEAKFYESMFGMKTSPGGRPHRAQTVGDGYVGLNINPRKAGRPGRLDHFGIQVDDIEGAFEKLQKYDKVEWLKRPDTRPFAAFTTHDPDGNVFDLTKAGGDNLKDVYTHNDWQQDRTISHVGLRTMNPQAMAEFYMDVFDLAPANLDIECEAYGVTDGRMTLVIIPWSIKDYADTGIVGPGMDYIGFKVEDIEAFKADVEEVIGANSLLAGLPVGMGKEGKARLAMLQRSSLGSHHIADPDGILLDITN